MGKVILGKIYVGDNENVIFTIEDGVSSIFLIDDKCNHRLLLDDSDADKKLNFNEHHQITGTFRMRKGCQKTIYFTDNYNPPRYLDISDVNSFREIISTSPSVEYGAVDVDKLLLQKVYDQTPKIELEIFNDGQLLSGSYNISIRYIDSDFNSSEWIETTEPIMIWRDNNKNYTTTRVSSNTDDDFNKYGPTNKSIKVWCDNSKLDHSYNYIQFALIEASAGTGFVNNVTYSHLIELDFGKDLNGNYNPTPLYYTFKGDSQGYKGDLNDILFHSIVYDKAKTLEQCNNKLLLGNVTETDVDWGHLQKYASRITADCIVKEINTIDYEESHKNPMCLFNGGVGYQQGEIYSFGIVYVLENGVKSPVYHIPGRKKKRNPTDPLLPYLNGRIPMSDTNNECTTKRYDSTTLSSEGLSYWGHDCNGDMLAGEKVRHHRFPINAKAIDVSTNSDISAQQRFISHYNLIVGILRGRAIKPRFRNNFDVIRVKYVVNTNEYNPSSMTDTLLDQEEVELNIQYKLKTYWESIYKRLDVSVSDTNGKLFAWGERDIFGCGRQRLRGRDFRIPFGDIENEGFLSSGDHSLNYNGFCGNPKKGVFPQIVGDCHTPEYICNQIRALNDCPTGVTLKKYKQHRYVDIYSIDITDGKYASFQCIQEYPQYRENNNDTNARPIFLTTGSVIVWNKYGKIRNNEKQLIVQDIMDEIDDSFFLNHVEALPRSAYSWLRYGTGARALKNGRRVRLEGTTNSYDDLEENGVSGVQYYRGNGKCTEIINSVLGFHIEPRIEIVETYKQADKRYIYGIEFGNVVKPDEKYLNGHKVIGYYIVQNERTEEDVTILDSAVMLPLFSESKGEGDLRKVITSGRLYATDHYVEWAKKSDYNIVTQPHTIFGGFNRFPINDIYQEVRGKKRNLVKDHLDGRGVGIIYPQFKFNHVEYFNFKFKLTGFFRKHYFERFSSDFNEAWTIQDVQPGTSYTKGINKLTGQDHDGYDLHIYHINDVLYFSPASADERMKYKALSCDEKNIHYMSPSTEIEQEFINGTNIYNDIVYNASGDNATGFMFNIKDHNGNIIDCRELFTDTGKNIDKYPYGYLCRDKEDYYPDFNERPYYIVSDLCDSFDDNRTLLQRSCKVFNGDCFISTINYTNSIFYNLRLKDRGKMNTYLMYAAGAVGTVAGIIIGKKVSQEAGAALLGASKALIQNGLNVDLAYSNQNAFIKEKSRDSIIDAYAHQVIEREAADDEIQWLCESLDGMCFESRLNLNWRISIAGDAYKSISDFLNPRSNYDPNSLRDYFTKKFTYTNKEQADGKMYRGYACAEIYELNRDFQRRNREKEYYCLPITYQVCSECKNHLGKRIVYSEDSYSEENVDNYRVIKPNNYTDINGSNGDIVHLYFNGESYVYAFAEEGLWLLQPYTNDRNREEATIRFFGNGDLFSTPAILMNKEGSNISYGSRHQNSFCNTPNGVFWFSEHDNAIYTIRDKDGVVDIFKSGGMGKFFEREGRIKTDEIYYDTFKASYPFKDNPSSPLGSGYILGWDNKYGRLLITKKDSYVDFDGECFYDSRDEKKVALMRFISSLRDADKVNISYRWSQEKCCYIVDYEDMTRNLIDVSTILEDIVYGDNGTYDVVVLGDTVLGNHSFFEEITNSIRSSRRNTLYIIEDSPIAQDFFDANSDRCIIINGDHFRSAYDRVSKLGLDKVSRISFIGTNIEYPESKKEIVYICNSFASHNIPIDLYPIASIEQEKVPFSNFEDMLSYYGVTASSYDDSLIDDEYIQCLEKVDLTKPNEEIKSTLSEYTEILSSLYNDILEAVNEIREEEYSIKLFKSIADILVDANTYSYWNKIKNSYNFEINDDYSNGNLNLIAFKGVSDEFDLFAYKELEGNYYEVNSDAYNKLHEAIRLSELTISKDISNIVGENIVEFCRALFNDIYKKYSTVEVEPLYNKNKQGSRSIVEATLEAFNINSNSYIYYSDDMPIKAEITPNNIIGNNVIENVYFHTTFFVENTSSGVRTDFTLSPSRYIPIEREVTIAQEVSSGKIPVIKWREYREYLYNNSSAVDESLDTYIESISKKGVDNSFTISYKPDMGFVSFHSYLPHIYIYTPNNIYTWVYDNEECNIYKHNVRGDYLSYYGERFPFVIEFTNTNDNIVYGNVINESMTILLKAYRYDAITGDFTDVNNVFFTSAYFYNSRQFSPLKGLYIKDSDRTNYFSSYLNLSRNEIAVEHRDGHWNINDIRDDRTIYNIPIHTYNKADRDAFMAVNNLKGWIDKAPNNICTAKSWLEVEPFKDNFICGRFFYNQKIGDQNVKIIISLNNINQTLIQTSI